MSDTDKSFSPKTVYSVAGGHLFHDLFSSFLAPLLPEIIRKLSLSLTSAGALTTLIRLPALFNPLLGYLADKTGARYFVILAPGLTATFMSLIGASPSIWSLALLLVMAGISIAMFHAPSPAMIGDTAGEKVGFGMSLFMAGGGIGRTIGPLLIVWAIGMWGLEGTYRLMIIGWLSSIVLLWQLRNVDITAHETPPLWDNLPAFRSFFLPLTGILFLRNFLMVALTTFLPTYMRQSGAPLWIAGASLSTLELSGVAGSLVIGPLSDRIGRRKTLMLAMAVSGVTILGFLQVAGWMVVPFLIILGLSIKSTGTVFLALVQDHFQSNRATGNGMYMLLSFLTNAAMLVLIGVIGDLASLRTAYYISSLTAFLTLPALLTLPAEDVV